MFRKVKFELKELKFYTFRNSTRFTNLSLLSILIIISYIVFYCIFLTLYIYISYSDGVPETYVFGNNFAIKLFHLAFRFFSGYLLTPSSFGLMCNNLILIRHLISIQYNLKLLHVTGTNQHHVLNDVRYQRKVGHVLRLCVIEFIKNKA